MSRLGSLKWFSCNYFFFLMNSNTAFFPQIHRSCDKLEGQFGSVSFDIGGVEGQLMEHEASKQAVQELLRFAQNEAESIISKIKEQVKLLLMTVLYITKKKRSSL